MHFLFVKNAYQRKCTLPPTIPEQTPLPHPLYNTPPPPMNSLRTLLYKFPPRVTGISHDDSNEVLQSISQMIKVC